MNHLVPLAGVALALAALVWYDHQNRDEQGTVVAAVHRDPTVSGGLADGSLQSESPAKDRTSQGRDESAMTETWGQPVEQPEQSGVPSQQEATNPLSSLDISQMKQTVERPLFAPSRRRPPKAEKKVSEAKTVTDDYELLGIARTEKNSIALLRRLADGIYFRAQPGDVIGNNQLAKIHRNAIVLMKADGTSRSIKLGAKKIACKAGDNRPECKDAGPRMLPLFAP